MTGLTLAEVGERWPEALVLWDRDVAAHVDWTVVFRGAGGALFLRADDAECGGGRCRCLAWDGVGWVTVDHGITEMQRLFGRRPFIRRPFAGNFAGTDDRDPYEGRTPWPHPSEESEAESGD